MKKLIGTPELMIAATLAALVLLGLAFGGAAGSGNSKSAASSVVAKVGVIAQRVEAIRGLRYRHVPKPVVVTPAETQRAAVADLNRGSARRQSEADSELLELLGLVPPGTDLRNIEGAVSGEEVVGFYDTRSKKLAIVNGPSLSDEVTTEVTLAHELDHALDDQRFGIRDTSGAGTDDQASAYTALIEGIATRVMDEYARQYVNPVEAFGSALSGLGAGGAATRSVPPYVQRSLEFSYLAGEGFVGALYGVAGDWRLVNLALAGHPPRSTEQIMHPEKYLTGEKPIPVPISDLGPALGPGWTKRAAGTVGEFDTGQILQLGVSKDAAARAAAGWGGGSYALWSNAAAARGCPAPCRRADALVLDWRWDTPRDATEFAAAARRYVAGALHGRAAIATGPRATVLVLGPSPAVSAKLATRLIRPAGG